VRPYISEQQTRRPVPTISPASQLAESQSQPAFTPTAREAPQNERERDIENRIRSAVIARLGNQVDAKLLDSIIHRVVKGVGLK
jgi:hypothetical protein